MFDLYTIAIAGLVVGGMLWGAYQRNDTFHPLVYLLPMAGYVYVVLPTFLSEEELLRHFTYGELQYVQGLNLACVAALVVGVLVGDRGLRRDPGRQSLFLAGLTRKKQRLIRRVALTLGVAGVLIFVYGLYNVGGFVAAFDSPKGGGYATTGWLRDLKLLVIPAIGLLYLSQRGRSWTPESWFWLGLFSIPLLSRSLLATSRGWTFMAAAALGAGWYLANDRRPRLSTLLGGAAVLGVLMLTLVTFRNQIYIGSGFFAGDRPALSTMVDEALDRPTQGGYGNEFIYGGYAVLLAERENDHYWGRRYLAYTFVRPIPSLVWPNKYEAVGVSGIRRNAGTLGEQHTGGVYESLANGLYPGLAGDLFVEFAWGAVLAAFLFGCLYGVGWRWLLVYGGPWTIVYLALLAFSVFAMMQTVPAAFVARFLIVVVPTLLLWWRWMPLPGREAPYIRRASPAAS
jgi:hypothetical protein